MAEFNVDWLNDDVWDYEDDNGDHHPCVWRDTMPGKGGYLGIVYLNRQNSQSDAVEVFEFVEIDRVTKP